MVLATVFSFVSEAHADDSYRVVVQLKGVRVDQGGMVRCSLFKSKSGFPSNYKRAIARQSVKVGEAHVCRFDVAKPGNYAVAVLHDRNQNGRMDTNIVGAPKEGWAVSKNTKPLFRAPRFSESKIHINQRLTTLRVAMRY